MSGARPEDVLGFWIGECDEHGLPAQERSRSWFTGGPAFDDEIRARFGPSIEAALAGELDGWCATPQGRVAVILLLDQMTRNAFRGTARAFAGDARARDLVLEALRTGEEEELAPIERYFLYMPLMHAEDAELQAESVARFRRLAEDDPVPSGSLLSGGVRWALDHQGEIERFGRFPGRNEAQGRDSTGEEQAFLASRN